jgi:hypothetical protein
MSHMSERCTLLEVVGVAGGQRQFHPFSELLAGRGHGVGICPVEYVAVADSPDSTRSCVRFFAEADI